MSLTSSQISSSSTVEKKPVKAATALLSLPPPPAHTLLRSLHKQQQLCATDEGENLRNCHFSAQQFSVCSSVRPASRFDSHSDCRCVCNRQTTIFLLLVHLRFHSSSSNFLSPSSFSKSFSTGESERTGKCVCVCVCLLNANGTLCVHTQQGTLRVLLLLLVLLSLFLILQCAN